MLSKYGNLYYRMFRHRKTLEDKGLNYNQQGIAYFTCKNYFTSFTPTERKAFKTLIHRCVQGREEYYNAVFEYLVGERTVEEIIEGTSLSRSSMFRYIEEVYLNMNYVRKIY